MRKVSAKWAWPIVTFVLVGVFMVVAVLLRGGSGASDAATPNTFLPPLEPAQHVTTREWRTIASDPAGHPDARVVLWGRVTRYDATVDPSSFAANVDSARHAPHDGVVNYPTPVILHGAPDVLQKLVPGYIFTAEVTVNAAGGAGGAARPGTGPGANAGAGVPELTVTKLTITDKTVG